MWFSILLFVWFLVHAFFALWEAWWGSKKCGEPHTGHFFTFFCVCICNLLFAWGILHYLL